jgi:Protein of unknown function (DUF3723)
VKTGPGEKPKWRCGIPTKRAYEEDDEFLAVDHLHSETEEEGEGITSFFVCKSVYLVFLGRPVQESLIQVQTGRAEDTDDAKCAWFWNSIAGEAYTTRAGDACATRAREA